MLDRDPKQRPNCKAVVSTAQKIQEMDNSENTCTAEYLIDRVTQNDSKTFAKRSQNDPKIIPKILQNDQKLILK